MDNKKNSNTNTAERLEKKFIVPLNEMGRFVDRDNDIVRESSSRDKYNQKKSD